MAGISLGNYEQPQGVPIDLSQKTPTVPLNPIKTVPNPVPVINPVKPPVSNPQPNVGGNSVSIPDSHNFGKAVGIARAIREHETGGVAKPGATGELSSMYQFLPGTWASSAKDILGDENAPLTPANENKVAVTKIQRWLGQGYGIDQIASLWNHGDANYEGVVGVHTNEDGSQVKYNTPAYVKAVQNLYNTKYANDNFATNVDKKRQQGLSDTDILQKITGKNQDYANAYQRLKDKGMNDTDALNSMTLSYSGKMPTVQSKTPAPTEQKVPFSMDKEFTGLGKSFVNTGLNMAAPIYDAPNNIAKLFNGGKDIYTPLQQTKFAKEEATARSGEKIGNTIGNISQFFIPGEASLKAGNALEKIVPKVAPKIIQKGANLLGRIGTEAGVNAGITALQGNPEQAKSAAILGGIAPVAGKVIEGVGSLISKGAGRTINSLIKPLAKDFAFGKNPGKAVAEEGITANSFEQLADNIKAKRDEIGKQIGDNLAMSKKPVNATDVFKNIDQTLIDANKKKGTMPNLVNKLEGVKSDITNFIQSDLGGKDLSKLTAGEANKLKQFVGELQTWTGNATEDTIANKALKQTYGNIMAKIEGNIPGIKQLNERWGNLLTAEKATVYRDKIAQRQNIVGMAAKGLGGMGVVYGVGSYLQTGDPKQLEFALAGLGTAGLEKVMGSVAVKTRLAKLLANAGTKQIETLTTKYPQLKRILGDQSIETENNVAKKLLKPIIKDEIKPTTNILNLQKSAIKNNTQKSIIKTDVINKVKKYKILDLRNFKK